MRQKLITPVLFLLMPILLGMWGQYEISPAKLDQDNFSTSLYEVAMLFFVAGEWTLEISTIPWQIDLARYLAPFAFFGSIVFVLAETAQISFSNYFVRFYSAHIIVVGLGDKSLQFVRTCKNRLVVVERNPENLLVQQVRQMGIRVIIGDIFNDQMFQQTNLLQATALIAFTGDDGSNVELAIKTRNHVREKADYQRHIKIHIHLDDIRLAHQLESYPKFFADYPNTEVSFFSVYDLSARALLEEYPPEIFADVAAQPRVHFAIYGFKRLAETLMLEAAQLCQYTNGNKLRFTIFDEDASNKEIALKSGNPYLSKICDYEFIQQSTFGPHVLSGEVAELLPSITQHIVCKDTDEENLSTALMLRAALLENKASNAPILVRMQQSSGLAQLLESNTGDPEIPDGLYPFGMLDQVLHVDNILTNKLDEQARIIYKIYEESQGVAPNVSDPDKSWNDLNQRERKGNLLKAYHWQVRLRAIRFSPNVEPTEPQILTHAEAESIAIMEHNRYVSQRLLDGWQYGEVRVREAKINPTLIPWSNMPSEQQYKEISDAQIEHQDFALKADQFTKRNYVLAVTGHRLHKLDVNNKKLQDSIISALLSLQEEFPDRNFIIMSPLAEGADRLVAKLAMQVLNASLHVALPLPFDLYETDFTTPESVEEFKNLVGKAEYYYEIPMRFGNIRELASGEDGSSNEARNKQYALAGAYLIQRCDRLIAVYDGKPEAGTGGTGQIVRWYIEGGMESEYHYPNDFFLAPQKGEIILLDPNP